MLNLDSSERNRTTQIRIQIDIPQQFRQEPIVFNLATRHHLKVNILSALLGKGTEGNGSFDIELRGKSKDIENALKYLSELGIPTRQESGSETDGW